MSQLDIPGGNTLRVVLQSVFKQRQARARDILIDELKHGDKLLTDVGEVAAIIYRYARAAQEGTARLNLRLMARVIAGQAQIGNLIADEFLYYADMLASLRREEIIFIATLHREQTKAKAKGSEEGSKTQQEIWDRVKAELIPILIPDDGSLLAVASSTMRTGLVVNDTTFNIDGGFITSPLMDRLAALASFEDALAQESR